MKPETAKVKQKGRSKSLISCPVLSYFLSTVYCAGPLSGKDAAYVSGRGLLRALLQNY